MDTTPAMIVLQDGTIFHGQLFGAPNTPVFGEVVFNTAMTGYQEILSDKSYHGQIVVFTFPHIGIVGTNEEDQESDGAYVSGCIMQDLDIHPENWRAQGTLSTYLTTHNIPALTGVDTRALTNHIRTHGAMMACITPAHLLSEAQTELATTPAIGDSDLSAQVTTPAPYAWHSTNYPDHHFLCAADSICHVVVVDFGVKQEILRQLARLRARVTVVPASSTLDDIKAYQPDGVLLSNGPGDPRAASRGIALTRELMTLSIPVYGICFGHQLMALAQDAAITTMKFGHHGANHPLVEVDTGRVHISSQNHNYVVDDTGLPSHVQVTHRSLFDQTIAAVAYQGTPHASFQGHPEAAPGPTENHIHFDHFIAAVTAQKNPLGG